MSRGALRRASAQGRTDRPAAGRAGGGLLRRPGIGTVLGAVLVAALACGPDGPATAGDVALPWTAPTAFTLGGVDAPDWAAFGEATGVAFDDAGRLYVLDGQVRRVTVVDSAGTHLGSVGAPGDGPGELRFPSDLVVHPDGAVTVLDPGHGGFVVYGAGGTYLRTVPVDPADPGMPAGRLRLGADGGLYAPAEREGVETDGSDPGPRRLVRFSDGPGGRHREVARAWRPPVPETGDLDPEATGGLRVRLPPVLGFSPEVHLGVLRDGRLAVVDSFAYRIRLVPVGEGGDGGASGVLSRPFDPVSVTAALRDAERERRLAEVMEDPARRVVSDAQGQVAAAPTSAVQRLERARVDAMGFYDLVPVVTALGVDPDGRIWVQRSGARPGEPGPVDVLGVPDGYLGTLAPESWRVPDAFGPNGLAAWIGEDALGAPTVRVGRIRAGG